MKKILNAFFIVTILLINGCELTPLEDNLVILSEDSGKYIPLVVNATWTRTITIEDALEGISTTSFTDSITGKTAIDGNIYYICKYNNDEQCLLRIDGNTCYYRSMSENGNGSAQKSNTGADIFSEDIPLFVFGSELNDIWIMETGTETNEHGSVTWTTTCEYAGIESVESSDGTDSYPDCAKFIILKVSSFDETMTVREIWTIWLSKNIGLVREEYEKKEDNIVVSTHVTGLISYNIPNPPDFYIISGKITNSSGDGIGSVVVTLTGDSTFTAISSYSEDNGFYRFLDIPESSYTIKAARMGHIFSPDSLNVLIVNSDVSEQNFVATQIPDTFVISGLITDNNDNFIPDVLITAKADSTYTSVSLENGEYFFSDMTDSICVITPVKEGFTFEPFSVVIEYEGEDITNLNFTGTPIPQTYTISGTITDSINNGIADVSVALSGNSSYSEYTTESGQYSFIDIPVDSYSLTPSHEHYSFEPVSINITVEDNDISGQNFSAIPITHTISGTITGADSVTVILSGDDSDSMVLNNGDSYSFTVMHSESYTVTPEKVGYIFIPQSADVSNVISDITQDFSASQISYTISGTVTGADGVTVILSGDSSDNKVINVGENYSFTVAHGGSYTVTPEKTGYIFTPQSADVSNVMSDIIRDFSAEQTTYTVSGTVTGADGVTVILSGDSSDSKVINVGENYSFNVAHGGSYTVTPEKTGYTFSPQSADISDITSDIIQDFSATQVIYTIAGTVTGANNVTVILSGDSSDSKVINVGENYSFNVAHGGSYTVTPEKTGYTFSPQSADISDITSDIIQDFSAAQITYTISGTVTDANNVTVTLSGDTSDSMVVNDGENFSFNVAHGGNYTLTPEKTGYIFTPQSAEVSNVTSNITQDFSAEQTTYTISGTVIDADSVTVTLSGDSSDTMVVNDGDSYSFTVTHGGSYTITPEKSGYIFTPQSANFSDVTSDITQDFSAVQITYKISGVVTGADGVTLILSGDSSDSKIVNDGKSYYFTLAQGGNYTITPQKYGYEFTPASVSLKNVTSDNTQSFSGVQITFTISGIVNGADDVTVKLTGDASGSMSVDDGKSYSFTVPYGGSYTVTPEKLGYIFSPEFADFSNMTSNETQNFTAEVETYTVSGTIEDEFSVEIDSVTVTLTQEFGEIQKIATGINQWYTVTDASGYYEFTGVYNGSYTITPSKDGFFFDPPEDSFNIYYADEPNHNFTGSEEGKY
ncbi:beta-sandwich domain-containing protein [Candidatus Latescibacterota bacterium]